MSPRRGTLQEEVSRTLLVDSLRDAAARLDRAAFALGSALEAVDCVEAVRARVQVWGLVNDLRMVRKRCEVVLQEVLR